MSSNNNNGGRAQRPNRPQQGFGGAGNNNNGKNKGNANGGNQPNGGGRGPNNNNGAGGRQNDASKQTSQLMMAFLQMYRLGTAVPQTIADLKARTNEYGVQPSDSTSIVQSALRMLGAGAIFAPKESVFLKPMADAAPGQAGTTFTIMSSAKGLAASIASASAPPAGVIGIVARGTPPALHWVIASHADNAPPTKLTWAPTADDSKIWVGELTKMLHSFSGAVCYVASGTGRFASTDCGTPLHSDLSAAISGNANAILKCGYMFAGGSFVPPPPGALEHGRPTPLAMISFISWLSTAMNNPLALAAAAGEQQMNWKG